MKRYISYLRLIGKEAEAEGNVIYVKSNAVTALHWHKPQVNQERYSNIREPESTNIIC